MLYSVETINLSKGFLISRSLSEFILRPFGERKTNLVISSVNLKVKEGELFGLIGPNGAGKTTLIKVLCCLILPTCGKAKVAGFDILDNEDEVKKCIGLVNGDERSFYWRLTGRQNLQFFSSLYNLSSNEAENRIKELIDVLEIDGPDKRFQEYSAGMKQRLAIARGLLNSPKVLFMDEPTKSLDPRTAYNLRKFIKDKLSHQQGRSIFFATHNLDETEYLADRIAIMEKGSIRACDTVERLQKEISKCFFAK